MKKKSEGMHRDDLEREQFLADTEAELEAIKERRFKKLESQLIKVTPELFGRFLDERGASKICLSCGSNQLSVPETTTIQSVKIPENYNQLSNDEQLEAMSEASIQHVSYSFIESEEMPRIANVKYRVNCLNCGFISFYRAAPVVKWVLDREKGDKDE